MRVAVITANIGNFDNVAPLPPQTVPFDYYCFTDENLPFPLSALSNRMKGKFCKFQAHKFLDYDWYIWLDGRIEVTSDRFIEDIINSGADVVCTPHPVRATTGAEYDWMITNYNEYLSSRYTLEGLKEESELIPTGIPLLSGFFFAYKKSQSVLFDKIWLNVIRYSDFDQGFLSYILEGAKLIDWRNYFRIRKHKDVEDKFGGKVYCYE
ncbi:MAG TPA: hypothetical protein PKA77_16645 [Chitinophagaceae bacterium]|nr:hypothetical protein [Chitinophagaceae bacterium]